MEARRTRVVAACVALIVGVGAAEYAIWFASKTGPSALHPPAFFPDEAAATTLQHEEPGEMPVVRQALPFEPAIKAVPIGVEITSALLPVEDEAEQRVFTRVDRTLEAEGRIVVELGWTNGFGGIGAEVTLDRNAKSALAVGYWFGDTGPPFEYYWEDVRGRVRLMSWTFGRDSLIDVDIQGTWRGEEYTLHVCTTLYDKSGL